MRPYPEYLTALCHEAVTTVIDDRVKGALTRRGLLLLLLQHGQSLLRQWSWLQ